MVYIEEKNKTIVPTNDYVFKKIFGQIGNEKITKEFISSIIGKQLTTINLEENTILEKGLPKEKVGILDIKATLDEETLCNIEVQVLNSKDIEKRILYYWSKLYSQSIKSGERHSELKKTITILIANFKLKSLNEIEKFHTEWEIREKDYQKIVLTESLEFHIVELPKLEKIIETGIIPEEDKKLAIWGKFLINPDGLGEKEMHENKEVKMAKEELEKMRQDKYEAELARLRQKAIWEEQAIEDYGYDNGFKEGEKAGEKKGKETGKREGEYNAKIKIAKELLKENMPIEKIMAITKLTKEEVEKIKK